MLYQFKKKTNIHISVLVEIISHHLSLVNVAHWPYSHHLTQKKLTTSNICNADATALPGKPCLPCTKWKCANCSRTEFLFSHNMNMQTGETVRVTREAQSRFPHRKSCWPRYWIFLIAPLHNRGCFFVCVSHNILWRQQPPPTLFNSARSKKALTAQQQQQQKKNAVCYLHLGFVNFVTVWQTSSVFHVVLRRQ